MRWKSSTEKLQCRIRICEQGGRDKIHSELQKAREEYKENTLLLEEKAKTCRSQAVTRLTQAQLDYRKKIGESMRKQIVRDLHTSDSSSREDEEEADMLYAEFAMDFATLAMQQALISALKALTARNHQKILIRNRRQEVQTQNQHRGKERMRNAGSKKTEKAIDLLLYNRACRPADI